MKTRFTRIGSAAMLAALVGTAFGADCASEGCTAEHQAAEKQGLENQAQENQAVPDGLAHPDALVEREIARRMLPLMPKEHRDAIIAAGGIGSEDMQVHVHGLACETVPANITPREYLAKVISPELGARMTEIQWQIANGIVATLERGEQPPPLCFHPDTDPEYAYAINQLIEFPLTVRFQQTNRWSNTATDGPGLSQGQPTTITYSFVPDGTFVPNLIGVSGNSNLRAWLNGIYGSQANWQPLFEQVFDRWSQLIGTTYVYEPNDDGSTLNQNIGLLGVRGDVRIAAITIDGGGGTLAYNNFPNDGDMVFDSADSFYNNTGGNSLRFRNVTAHEHGHGLGMLHVCPANQTKLMEPFVSTAYNGPQLDDILNGHRHYGDPMEPFTDSPGTAPSLGAFGINGNTLLQNVSIDGSGDVDYYRITANVPSQIQVTVGPDAGVYLQGTQTQQCNTGTNTDYNSIRDLRIDIFAAGDTNNPVASVDDAGVGESELLVYNINQPGDYFIRVSATGTNNVQRYVLGAFFTELPFQVPSIVANPPTLVEPGEPTSFAVTVSPGDDTLVGTPELFYRLDGGGYQTVDLVSNGGNSYTATLPPVACDDTLQFYISTEGDSSGQVTLPINGAFAPFEALAGSIELVFADNFSTNLGWVVGAPDDTATAGIWTRVNPIGTSSGGTQVQPNAPLFGTAAYVTGQHTGSSNIGDNDVDNGKTTLISPALDLTEYNSPVTVSYWRWFSNDAGASPNTDVFTVDVSSDNGVTWVNVETVGPSGPEVSGGWFQNAFEVGSLVSLTDQVRVRFVASDFDPGSLVEAAVDGFLVEGRLCEDAGPTGCSVADLAEPFGTVNVFDLFAYLNLYSASDPAADLAEPFGIINVFDLFEYLEIYSAGCP